MARARANRFSRGFEREPQSRPVMFSGTLVVLIIGALLVLWLLGAGSSTLENCHKGDINACAELKADHSDRYR
jgi:hypothetical protein